MRYDATQKYHEFLKAITQHAADGIMAFAHTGQITLANEVIGHIFGYDRAELEGMNIRTLLGGEHVDGSALCRLFDRFDPDGEHMPPLMLKGNHRTGVQVPIEIAVGSTVLTDGERVYVASCRDVSERLKVESQLKSQSEIIRQMSDGMVVMDEDLRVTECNRAAAKIVGMRRSEILGHQMHALLDFHASDDTAPQKVLDVARGKGRWNGIIEFTNKTGKDIKSDVAIFPISDIYGASTMFAAVIRDVTKRIAAEERISKTQQIEALGRLAGGVAHDVNNLLFPIFLNLESVYSGLEDKEGFDEAREDLSDAMEACQKIKAMIQNILLFSRKNSMDANELDISEEMTNAWNLSRMVVPSSVECNVSIERDCGSFRANSVQFSQVVLNLVSNAVAAMDGVVGKLGVSLKRTDARHIPNPKYYKLRQNEIVEIRIADNGLGIAEEHLDKIFNPFFTTKEVGKGTGLGLTEVTGIVKALCGAIDVRSEVGKGTEFIIYLPVRAQMKEKTTDDVHQLMHT